MHFFGRLETLSQQNGTLLCVGLDTDPKRLPQWAFDDPNPVLAFNRHIIDLTCDLVCAYKPNAAFYEALGPQGWETLRETIAYAHQSGVPVILDAKRNDIGSSAEAYARSAFEKLKADAITINPYMGWDSVEPFLRYAERGVFVVTLTSNGGAQDFQCLDGDGRTLYEHVAEQAVGWNERGNVGLVAGATYPNEVCSVRALAPDEWFLMPGVGQQGGDLEAALKNGLRADASGVIVNASRSIIYAEDPREAAMTLRAQIEAIRAKFRGGDGGCEPATQPNSVTPNLIDLAIGLYEVGAIQFGDFTLQSGQPSPFYIDLRLIIGDSDVLAHAARAYVEILNNADVYYNRIAAIPYAALPISTAISLQAKVPLVWPRKERKAYGTMRAIEGPFEPGETVVVVDDLITTGRSKMEALKPLREAGLRVKDIAVLIDREGGGREEMEAQGINVHSVFRLRELMEILYEHDRITAEQKAAVERFVAGQTEAVA